MKRDGRESKIKKGVKTLKNDYVLRTFIFSALSFFVTVIFAAYNIFLGAAYKTEWNFGIAIYYALLVGMRAYIMFAEKKVHNADLPDGQKQSLRAKRYVIQSAMLLLVDLALIAPVSMMVLQKKQADYSQIPAIAMAAYTVYKIVTASANYAKTRKHENLSVKILKNISLIDALVSILSLQYVLIMTFGSGIEGEMFTLCAVTSFAIWSLVIAVSVISVINAVKVKRSLTNN